MRRTRLGMVLGAIGVLLVALANGPAASADDLDPRIVAALAAEPGGQVVDDDTVVWPDLGMELQLAPVNSRSVGTCATGMHCAFQGTNMTGSKLSWSTCSASHSAAALPTVKSIANARSTGSSKARSAAGGVLATASAGGWANVSGTVSYVSCTT